MTRLADARARLWSSLPNGHSLPAEVWRRRHRGIVALVVVHAAGLVCYGLATGHRLDATLAETSLVAACAALASWDHRSQAFRSAAATVGLMISAALLVSFSGGEIAMHFHFFVVIAVIALYQDWVPFLIALAFVVAEHGVIGVIFPAAVYGNSAESRNPWLWALIHGSFVLAASAAQLTTWRLNEIGFFDPLTGLANRKLFMDRVELALARANRYGEAVAVLFVDLDDFKTVNDSRGHGAGDRVLVAVAHRVTGSVRPFDTVARLGGDEFAVLVERMTDLGDVDPIARRILSALQAPLDLGGHEVTATASIGIAISPAGAESADDLIRNADLAMYVAKTSGKGRYETFADHMYDNLVERLQIQRDLGSAIEKGEFVLHYQPVIAPVTDRLAGVEALVRWQHPTRGLLPPDQFIPVAEAAGLIVPLGTWVLGQACRDARRWQDRYPSEPPLTVAVNVAAAQLRPELAGEVRAALEAAGLPPHSLVLEITESALIDETGPAIACLHELKQLGVSLAIDDFGTGYSSLSRLRHFPVDAVKIDRSFVADLAHHDKGPALIRSMMSVAASLGLTVVAEGVETVEQLDFFRDERCELVQGYLLSRPIDAQGIDLLLARPTDHPYPARSPVV